MRRRRARPAGGVDDGVLPLVNVVFLLLIFFLVAGELAQSDPFEVEPPRSDAEAAAPAAPPAAPPVVLIGADGAHALDGAALDREALIAAVAEGVAAGRVDALRVRADGRAEARVVVALLGALRATGVREIRLLTEARGP